MVGYTHRGTGKVFAAELAQGHFDRHATLALGSIAVRSMGGDCTSREALARGMADLPSWGTCSCDFMFWYWGSMGLFLALGPEEKRWLKWRAQVEAALMPNQGADGSWPSADRWSEEGGPVYATAINALTLETPVRCALR